MFHQIYIWKKYELINFSKFFKTEALFKNKFHWEEMSGWNISFAKGTGFSTFLCKYIPVVPYHELKRNKKKAIKSTTIVNMLCRDIFYRKQSRVIGINRKVKEETKK